LSLLDLLTLSLLLNGVSGTVAACFELSQTLLVGSYSGLDFTDAHQSI